MARFTTRVELHDATYKDYETLHDAMQAVGFSRTITSDGGLRYHLPLAEYDFDDDHTRDEVLELAKSAAAHTSRRYAILVTESAGRRWVGLTPA